MVVVTDIPTNVYRIGEVIKKLDQLTPQAYIDSKVVRTEAGLAENLGIQWNPEVSLSGSSRPTTFPFTSTKDTITPVINQFFPVTTPGDVPVVNPTDARNFPQNPVESTTGSGFAYGTLDFSSFSAVLQMLKSYSNTKIVSNPRVVVLNNQTAHIQVGEQVPLPTFERNETTGGLVVSGFNYRDVGVVLNVTPHINSAEEILVDLKPEVSSMGPLLTFTADLSAPRFNITQAQTQVLIQSGQTIAIGGLMTDNNALNEDKVPYLADIPLVGKLFRSKRQTAGSGNAKIETLFFVTVTMVDSKGQPSGEKVAAKKDRNKTEKAGTAVKSQADNSPVSEPAEAPSSETKSEAKT